MHFHIPGEYECTNLEKEIYIMKLQFVAFVDICILLCAGNLDICNFPLTLLFEQGTVIISLRDRVCIN